MLFLLHGPDATTFLQGQTTADLTQLEIHGFAGGAFCDPKGRVLCDFLVLRIRQDAMLLRVHESVAGQLEAHLQKFLMFAKATLERDQRRVSGLCEVALPESLHASEHSHESTAIPFEEGYLLRREINFYEYWGHDPGVKQLADSLTLSVSEDNYVWYLHSIQRGEARITRATWGKYLPQDLNYDLCGWVSFKKGCYTGQEVIARLHWRGSPKRRLYCGCINTTVNADTSGLISEGSQITDKNGKSCGSVVNVVRLDSTHCIAFEATTAADGGELLIDNFGAVVSAITPFAS